MYIFVLAGFTDLCKNDLIASVLEGAHRSNGYLIVENEPIMSDNIQQQKNVQKYGHQFRKDLRISCMRFLSYAGFLKFSELAIYTCSLKRFDISLFTTLI